MVLCNHDFDLATCADCLGRPTMKRKKRAKAPKPKLKTPIVRDKTEILVMEYLAGIRCQLCGTRRTGHAFQCVCERAAILATNIAQVEAWAEAHPDEGRSKLTQTAASSAISRATLRAGLRNTPSPIEGLSMGSLIGLANRAGVNGRAMEWKDGLKPGDELPV